MEKTEISSETTSDLVALTAHIIASYVEKNAIRAQDLPETILAVHGALRGLGEPVAEPEPEIAKPTTAQARKSVRNEGLISFLDGKSYKTLKRHLARHGLTPDEYRERYGLGSDYPMVAPEYAARRSEMAKAIGLGRKAGGRKGRVTKAA